MKEHIKILDFIRGIAALGVVVYHFGTSSLPTIKPNFLNDILVFGKYGVQVFFVVSGFVIPYSMYKSNYRINSYFKTLLRRLIRIAPPAYVTMIMLVFLYMLSLLIKGDGIEGLSWTGVNLKTVVSNLFFISDYNSSEWYNPVCWTLGIEFQFYILIGLILPLLSGKNVILKYLVLSLLILSAFIGALSIFRYACFFVFGILLFMRKEKLLGDLPHLIFILFAISLVFYKRGFNEFIFGLSTYLIILSGFSIDFKWSNFLGKISYSLYITHWIVGTASEIIIKRIVIEPYSEIGKILMLIMYTVIAVYFSSIFYNLIESPFVSYSRIWTKRLRFKRV